MPIDLYVADIALPSKMGCLGPSMRTFVGTMCFSEGRRCRALLLCISHSVVWSGIAP